VAEAPGEFDRDTAVREVAADGPRRTYDATVAAGWRAGLGPHGGYLAAMILRALTEACGDPGRPVRSLTIHFLSAPAEGPVSIGTVLERRGRSLSSLSARMEQDGRPIALALAAFSVAWEGPEISHLDMPQVAPPDAVRRAGTVIEENGPPFARRITLQPRLGGLPFRGHADMEIGGWIGLADPRPVDALALAFLSDALIPAPFMVIDEPAPAPTVDLTIHFRAGAPGDAAADLCLALVRARLIQDGFFEEDSVIWAPDGTVLAHSRQLAILMQRPVG
jgi:acyl-CoA thioesterase